MSAHEGADLAIIKGLPIRARAAFALAVAEMVKGEFAEDSRVFAAVQDALCLSWKWVGGVNVKGEEIDHYIDSPTDNNLMRHVLRYPQGPAYAALAAAMQAVAYTGRKAYDAEGAKRMSDPLWQVEEDLLDDLLGYAMKTLRYDEAAVQRISSFLIDRYAAQGAEVLGSPVRSDEVLPLIVRQPTAK